MVLNLPCKLGEEFTALKFKEWVDGVQVYEEDKRYTLKCVDRGLYGTDCIGYDGCNNGKFFSYGEFSKQYINSADCKLVINDAYFESTKLSIWGFPSDRIGYLLGFKIEGSYILAHFVVLPRYEHFYYAIKELNYGEEQVVIKYDAVADKEWNEMSAVQSFFHHREEQAGDEVKEILVKMAIESAKRVGLKLRRIEIDKDRIKISEYYNGKLHYYVFVDKEILGERLKKIPKDKSGTDMTIKNDLIIFKYTEIRR